MARTRPAIEPRLLDRAAAATYCGVSVNHFLAHCPVEPFDGFGGKRLWDRAAIDRWIDGESGVTHDLTDDQWKKALAAI